MLERLLEAFSSSGLSLWGPFVMLVLCGVGLPVPEDIILITAGYLGADNGRQMMVTIVFMYLGIIIGDSIIFALGHFVGRRAMNWKLIRAFITPERLERAETLFKKYGTGVIFVGRFLPGLRAPIFFSAGFLKFKYWKFFAMDGVAALVSAPLFVWMGNWAVENDTLHLIKKKVGETQMYLIIGAAVLAIIVVTFVKNRHRFKSSDGKSYENP